MTLPHADQPQTAWPILVLRPLWFVAYTGDCGACIGIFPSYYTCTNCNHRPVQLRLRCLVRAAAPLTLTVRRS
uniref:Secreted protein n=1 Tax=Macrostomum lignano TaxID=282301 RepID=A0A1I8F972_9PLAT